MILTGDVFLVAGLRAEVTAVDIRRDMINVYYSVVGSKQQVGEFSTFVDGPFTIISRKAPSRWGHRLSDRCGDYCGRAVREWAHAKHYKHVSSNHSRINHR